MSQSSRVMSSQTPTIVALVTVPTNELIVRRPLPKRLAALLVRMNAPPHAVLATLSGSYSPLRGRSPTRYSAVRH